VPIVEEPTALTDAAPTPDEDDALEPDGDAPDSE
jgi:hypothetical protein